MTFKNIALTIILATAVATISAQPMAEAEQAYQAGNYNQAAALYEQVLQSGQESFALYYNLGNTYYRLDQNGLAILNYERALRLKPADSDTRENLALAQSRTTDRIAAIPQLFLARWYTALVQLMTPRGWRVLLLCLLAILCASVVALLLANSYRSRKILVMVGLSSVLLLVATTAITISSSVRASRHNYAIVTQQSVVVKGAPERDSVDKFIIHEGTKVKIDETLSGWHKIRLADGTTGWAQTTDIVII